MADDRSDAARGNDAEHGPTVVGIGASAGALSALKTFFQYVPEKTGIAFVVVVHLSPDHESHLAEVLQPYVRMPVQQVAQTVELARDRVYIIPPGCNLSAIDTHLRLTDLPERRHGRAPIDHFFRTLAQTHDGEAIGVILSGTGADGTLGVKEIKAKGGIVIVQDPNEAEYDGMPQNAIATGLADLVLPLRQIPAAILRSTRTAPKVVVPDDGGELEDDTARLLRRVFAQLRARTGRDFSRYKRSTILRRIARRMQLRHVEDLADYLEHLRHEPEEVRALTDDLLVTVTGFFRDAAVFDSLATLVIPALFESERQGDIRIWSVGCATGEEAYSLAILVLEEATRRNRSPALQVFATDLHEPSLQRGRDGLYLGDIEAEVSPARLQRYFHKENGGYRVRKELRELVVFAQHNLLADPPFSRMDLISCRNLLIYLQRDIQHDAIALFHYALKADGFLLLGTSETADAMELFSPVDKERCIYKKRNVPPPHPRLPVFPAIRTLRAGETEPRAEAQPPVAVGAMHERLVERYAPPSLLVGADDRLLHLSEHAGRFLEHPGGELTANVLKLVREDLRLELRAALLEARQKRQPVRARPVRVRFNGELRVVVVDVRPSLQRDQDGFALVIFNEFDSEAVTSVEVAASARDAAGDATQRRLAAELELTQNRLRDVVDQYEAGQEEMRASNEELQSANEELRSTMEELETSKEELQSINEELQTVNQENRNKVEELAQLSGDLNNLLASSDVATLFLDREFRIMRFTPKVASLFNVRGADRGRPLTDLTHRLGYDELINDAGSVLERLIPAEREVRDSSGAWYLTRVLPYRGSQDRIEGVVITFFDISERKRHEEELRDSQLQLQAEVEAMARLHELVNDLLVSRDLRSALDKVLAAAIEITGAAMGDVQMCGRERGSLEIVAQRGFSDEFLAHFADVGLGIGSTCSRVLASRKRVVIRDVQADAAFAPHREVAARAGFRAVQSTPLLSRDDELLGVLSTHHVEANVPTERDLRMLDLYARQAAEFIEYLRSREVLGETERRKDEFLAMLAHELRNPLATIRNTVALLKRSKQVDAEARRSSEVLEHQTELLARLVDDLLQLSRLMLGRIRLRLQPMALAPVVADAVNELEPLAGRSGPAISLDVPDESLWVRGDPTRLRQVFGNLLSNARRFTPDDGTVRVTAGAADGQATVSVRDSGAGIAAEHLAHVFDLFYQVPEAGADHEGLGIGLSLARSLVEAHGGQIEARSAGAGQGAEFIVRLPLAEPPDEADDERSGAAAAPAAAALKILIVDDDADLTMSQATLLRTFDHEVQTAADAAEALRIGRSFRPDVVLLDLGLPKVSGYEVARRIRAQDWGAPALLIAQSGRESDAETRRSKSARFDHYLTKPIDLPTLLGLLEQRKPA